MSACRKRGRRIKVGEGELSLRVQRIGIVKSLSFPSNVAGEKKLYLPECSKAAFVGVFFFPIFSQVLSAYLYVEGEKKNLYVMIKRSEQQLPAGISVGFCLLF